MSAIHRFNGTETAYNWETTLSKEYSGETSKDVSGKVIIGQNDGAGYFIFRYFCIGPGGHSTLDDYHAHDHGVYILHGHAVVTIEGNEFEVGPRDMIYISPLEHHHFITVGDEPLGFLCVIPNKEMLEKLATPI